jgi:hypothetical protein
LQARRLEQWRQAGAVIAVVHSVTEMREVMREAGARAREGWEGREVFDHTELA